MISCDLEEIEWVKQNFVSDHLAAEKDTNK